MFSTRVTGLCLAGSVCLSVAATAPAQEQSTLEEIIVTAQKRTQDMQDVNIAITAFTGDDIAQRGWTDITQVASQTPNLDIKYVWGNSMPVATIRGIGMSDFQANSKPGVGFYVDEVYLASIALMGLQLYDMERLEVLKGPQGTLFGRNTNGGAINYITRKPTRTAEGYLRGDFGRFERVELEGAVGGPLTDTTSARLSFLTMQQGEGHVSNRTTGRKNGEVDIWSARAQLLWEPTDRTDVLVNIHGGKDRSQPVYFQHVGFWNPGARAALPPAERFCAAVLEGRRDPATCVDVTGYSDTDGNPYAGDYTNKNGINFDDARLDNVNVGGSIHLDHEFANGLQLTSITAAEDYQRFQPKESDASPFLLTDLIFASKIRFYSQELRLASGGDSPFDWIVGVHYTEESVEEDPPRIAFFEDLLGGNLRARVEYAQEQWQAALFGHTEWELSDQWTLTVGARVIKEEIDFTSESSLLLPPAYDVGSRIVLAAVPNSSVSGAQDDENWTGRIALAYDPSDELMLYASVAKGYKGGGFNGGFVTNPALWRPYGPEDVRAYEVGIKSEFLNRRVIVNGAVFYNDYQGLQAVAQRPSATGVAQNFLANLTEATTEGVELELSARLTPQLDFRAGVGVLETENADPSPLFNGPFAPLVIAPRELANSPEYTFNVALAYDIPMENGSTVRLATDYFQTGKQYKEIQNNPALRVPEQGLWNARLSWRAPDENWRVSVWAKNLADEEYIVDTLNIADSTGWGVIVYGMPRTYGISTEYHW